MNSQQHQPKQQQRRGRKRKNSTVHGRDACGRRGNGVGGDGGRVRLLQPGTGGAGGPGGGQRGCAAEGAVAPAPLPRLPGGQLSAAGVLPYGAHDRAAAVLQVRLDAGPGVGAAQRRQADHRVQAEVPRVAAPAHDRAAACSGPPRPPPPPRIPRSGRVQPPLRLRPHAPRRGADAPQGPPQPLRQGGGRLLQRGRGRAAVRAPLPVRGAAARGGRRHLPAGDAQGRLHTAGGAGAGPGRRRPAPLRRRPPRPPRRRRRLRPALPRLRRRLRLRLPAAPPLTSLHQLSCHVDSEVDTALVNATSRSSGASPSDHPTILYAFSSTYKSSVPSGQLHTRTG